MMVLGGNIIVMCGAGAVGSNLLYNLCADRRSWKFFVIDYDKVEARNIEAGTQFYFREQIGLPKVNALRLNIFKMTGVKITGIRANITQVEQLFLPLRSPELKIDDNSKVVFIDGFDNSESRLLVQKVFELGRGNVLHVGFSPQKTFQIVWDIDFKPESVESVAGDFDICSMQGARSFIQFVCGLASNIVQLFIDTGEKRSVMGNGFLIRELR